MAKYDFYIRTQKDLADAIHAFGFVPLFQNPIPGFSVEEHVDPIAWFDSGADGVWEWKGPVIQQTGCAYGKFFQKKAVFISREWFLDFANYRRCGDDFETLFQNGEAPRTDKYLYDLVTAHGPVLSKRLKYYGDYHKGGRTGFDTIITRLQAETYVLISDFLYDFDRFGNRYGWGVAEYSTTEQFMGDAFAAHVCDRTPEESYARILEHLGGLLGVSEKELLKLV